MLPLKIICLLSDPTDEMFQSLFSWMFRSKGSRNNRPGTRARVSILVLVDVSLEVPLALLSGYIRAVSILVLVDVSLEV